MRPKRNSKCLYGEEGQGRSPTEEEEALGTWSDVDTKNTGNHQKLQETGKEPAPGPLKRVQPLGYLDFSPVMLISDLQSPEWGEKKFLLF